MVILQRQTPYRSNKVLHSQEFCVCVGHTEQMVVKVICKPFLANIGDHIAVAYCGERIVEEDEVEGITMYGTVVFLPL